MDEFTPTAAPRFEQIFQDAVALQQRDADRLEQQREREGRRRAQEQLNQRARRRLSEARQRAEVALRDLTDAPARRAFVEALVKCGPVLRRARGPASLETFLSPDAVPLPETVLGAHLLPLEFLIELLRLGQRREREVIDALLLRLPETPALDRFVEWFGVAADFLCGMHELDQGIRVPAPLPLPANDCSPANRAALFRILYASAELVPAVTTAGSPWQQVSDWAPKQEAGGESSSLSPSPPTPPVGVNEASGDKRPFGLLLVAPTRRAARNNRMVEFGGRNVAWKMFVQLCKRYPAYCPTEDLGHEACNEGWRADDPGLNTLYVHVSELNGLLKPLELHAKYTRPAGYRLEHSSS
jgi:hypothetical protein